jgi:hypothetical protein
LFNVISTQSPNTTKSVATGWFEDTPHLIELDPIIEDTT